jgi:hypothetical protein
VNVEYGTRIVVAVVCVLTFVWTLVNVLLLTSVDVVKVWTEKNGRASELRPIMAASAIIPPIRIFDGCIASDSPVMTN